MGGLMKTGGGTRTPKEFLFDFEKDFGRDLGELNLTKGLTDEIQGGKLDLSAGLGLLQLHLGPVSLQSNGLFRGLAATHVDRAASDPFSPIPQMTAGAALLSGNADNLLGLSELAFSEKFTPAYIGVVLLGLAAAGCLIRWIYLELKNLIERQNLEASRQTATIDPRISNEGPALRVDPSAGQINLSTLFDDLFRQLTLFPSENPGAEIFMKTVNDLIGKDGSASPSIATFDEAPTLLSAKTGKGVTVELRPEDKEIFILQLFDRSDGAPATTKDPNRNYTAYSLSLKYDQDGWLAGSQLKRFDFFDTSLINTVPAVAVMAALKGTQSGGHSSISSILADITPLETRWPRNDEATPVAEVAREAKFSMEETGDTGEIPVLIMEPEVLPTYGSLSEPTHIQIRRPSGIARFSGDLIGSLNDDISQLYQVGDHDMLKVVLQMLFKEWPALPNDEQVRILNSELERGESKIAPEDAQKTISFKWILNKLNGAPFLFTAEKHPVLDLFRKPLKLEGTSARQFVPREELHPFALDPNGNLRGFKTLADLTTALGKTELMEISDPRTAEDYVYKYTNAFGATIVVVKSFLFDDNGNAHLDPLSELANGGQRRHYHEHLVRYTFNKTGNLVGLEIVKNRVFAKGFAEKFQLMDRESLVTFGAAGRHISLAERDELAGILVSQNASVSIEEARGLVDSALRTWFLLPEEAQARVWNTESLVNRTIRMHDAVPASWLIYIATRYSKGVQPARSVNIRESEKTIRAENPALFLPKGLYNDGTRFTFRQVFGLNGNDYPPVALVEFLTTLFAEKEGIDDISRERLAESIRKGLTILADFADVYLGKTQTTHIGEAVPITVNGKPMEIALWRLFAQTRKILFGDKTSAGPGSLVSWLNDRLFPLKFSGTGATETVPRNLLSGLSLDNKRNLRPYHTVAELLGEIKRQKGKPNCQMNTNTLWWGLASVLELKKDTGIAEFLKSMRDEGSYLADIPIPNVAFRSVAVLYGASPTTAWGKNPTPYRCDTVYFFDEKGDRISLMVVKVKWNYRLGDGNANSSASISAKPVLVHHSQGVPGTIDEKRLTELTALVENMFSWKSDIDRENARYEIRAAVAKALRSWQSTTESDPATARTNPLDWIKILALEQLAVPGKQWPNARSYEKYKDERMIAYLKTGRNGIMIAVIKKVGDGIAALTPFFRRDR